MAIRQYLTFKVQDQNYAVEAKNIFEIVKKSEIQDLPLSGKNMMGFVQVRESTVFIIDFRLIIKGETTSKNKGSRIIIFKHDSKLLGLIADQVDTVLAIDDVKLLPNPIVGDAIYISGVTKIKEDEFAVINILNVFKQV